LDCVDSGDLRMTIYNTTFVDSIGSQHAKVTLILLATSKNKFSVHIISQCCELHKKYRSMRDYLNYPYIRGPPETYANS